MILVTGGTGLIGSHLLYQLCSNGHKVKSLFRSEQSIEKVKKVFEYYSSNADQLLQQIEWVKADILDLPKLELAFENVSHVYHCAALVSFHPKDYDALFQINVRGTENIVNLCLQYQVQKLCYVSSVAAIGKDEHIDTINEDVVWKNSPDYSNYALSKHASELEVWRGIVEGLDAVMVNPCIVLGPGFWNEGSSALFGTVHKGIPYYSLGSNCFVDVRDVIDAMTFLMDSEISGERFILAGANIKYQALLESIAHAVQSKAPQKAAAPWMGEVLWRIEAVRSRIFNTKPYITKETARTAQKDMLYSSDKYIQKTGLQFRDISESIQEFGSFFLKDLSN